MASWKDRNRCIGPWLLMQQSSHPTLAPPPQMGCNKTPYEAEFSALQTATLKRASHGALAPIGRADGAGPRHAKARPARGRRTSATDVAPCTVANIYTGPKTKDGPVRLTAARTTHGKYTKEKWVEAKRRAEVGRQMRAELKELDTWFVDHGHLDKKWRDCFKINE